MSLSKWSVWFALAFLGLATAKVTALDRTLENLQRDFDQQIVPLLAAHCLDCHGSLVQEAQLDLSVFRDLKQVNKSHPTWELVLERLDAKEMPPAEADRSLDEGDRQQMVQWIRDLRHFEAAKHAGDPGVVLAHRLSNAEYDYSIRDLTGVDLRPTQSFPVDPASAAGFDNSGESLSMSPALLTKYLEAARTVSEHLVFTPHGLDFASHPVVTDTDRDKYCVKRIVEFYQRQPTRLANYFLAAWTFKHRDTLGYADHTLAELAAQHEVSAKYLATIWTSLIAEVVPYGPMAELQRRWNALPEQDLSDPLALAQAREDCAALEAYVVQVRREFEPKISNLKIREVHSGSQPFVLWKNKQYAQQRRTADLSRLEAFLDKRSNKTPTQDSAEQDSTQDSTQVDAPLSDSAIIDPRYPFALPAQDDREQLMKACQQFCDIFPDAFYISERGRDYLDTPKDQQEKGRLLSAGFHSMMGYFRDDRPLYELILSPGEQVELDALWQELDFFAAAPQRQYQGFLWFERTDSRFMRDQVFDFARPENQAALTEPLIQQLAEHYSAKAAENGGDEIPMAAIDEYFTEINQQIRWVEKTRVDAEPEQIAALIELASRAHRRPLTSDQQQELRSFYDKLRTVDLLSHEEAIQDTLVSVLMSPEFCYRLDLLSDSARTRPLDDYELASRLSYFLWSSIPDAELMQQAALGKLHQPQVLLEQSNRMIRDERIRGLATEFGGNWLDFRRFEEHNSVDRTRFPQFNDALRTAMFEEPVRFLLDLMQQDRSILECLYSDRTFVNSDLAAHYGMLDVKLADGEWAEVSDAKRFDRGGLLPMSVFLTKNAPGLRTSPVKRGYWVVRRLLGERIPPPPPDVPELPNDEAQLGELSLRQTLAKHREHSSCAGCHDRFDAMGLVFEGYGPIGERRELDLGGRPVDTSAPFPDGSQRTGIDQLQSYLKEQREAEFVDNLGRKLLSYALGRSLQLSDESLVQSMKSELQNHEFRFSALVETIVTSPQFLNKRGSNTVDNE